jgi:hypothetical protein
MNNLKQILLLVTISIFVTACDNSMDYKYKDQPLLVTCTGADVQLMSEALYSFFDDITVYYRNIDAPLNEGLSTQEAYANFIYKGATGEADYASIVSDHSRKIIKKLKKDKNLWNMDGAYSNLNYSSEFVTCLFSKIRKEEFRTTIESLQKINSVSPKLLAERIRVSTRDAFEDPNFGMYVALDTYYQYLLDIEP